jgi:hypothetical protein
MNQVRKWFHHRQKAESDLNQQRRQPQPAYRNPLLRCLWYLIAGKDIGDEICIKAIKL